MVVLISLQANEVREGEAALPLRRRSADVVKSPAFNSPQRGLSAVWNYIVQYKGFCLYFPARYPHWSCACCLALRWEGGLWKLLVAPDWNSNQSRKPICQRQCVYRLNFDSKKTKQKKPPSLFTLSLHIWDCNALSWLHKYTPSVWFKWRGKVKASLPQCEQDMVSNEGERVQGEISHVVNMERISSFLLCALKLLCLHPSLSVRKGRLMCASSLLLTCVYVKKTPVFTSFVWTYEFMYVHMW